MKQEANNDSVQNNTEQKPLPTQRQLQRKFDNLLGKPFRLPESHDPGFGKVPHTGNQFYRHSGS